MDTNTALTANELYALWHTHQAVQSFWRTIYVDIAEFKISEHSQCWTFEDHDPEVPSDAREVWVKTVEVTFLDLTTQNAQMTAKISMVLPIDHHPSSPCWDFEKAELFLKCNEGHQHRIAVVDRNWELSESHCSLPKRSAS